MSFLPNFSDIESMHASAACFSGRLDDFSNMDVNCGRKAKQAFCVGCESFEL